MNQFNATKYSLLLFGDVNVQHDSIIADKFADDHNNLRLEKFLNQNGWKVNTMRYGKMEHFTYFKLSSDGSVDLSCPDNVFKGGMR